jgi:small subunit ribosomal protein S18
MPVRAERSKRPRVASRAGRAVQASCALCRDRVAWVDYKNVALLRRYVSERGRIRARQATGTCARHQEEISVAIKTARELVLLPYAPRPVSDQATATTTSGPLEMAGTTRGDRP